MLTRQSGYCPEVGQFPAVQVKGSHRSPASWRDANDLLIVDIPFKMICPGIFSRVEEG